MVSGEWVVRPGEMAPLYCFWWCRRPGLSRGKRGAGRGWRPGAGPRFRPRTACSRSQVDLADSLGRSASAAADAPAAEPCPRCSPWLALLPFLLGTHPYRQPARSLLNAHRNRCRPRYPRRAPSLLSTSFPTLEPPPSRSPAPPSRMSSPAAPPGGKPFKIISPEFHVIQTSTDGEFRQAMAVRYTGRSPAPRAPLPPWLSSDAQLTPTRLLCPPPLQSSATSKATLEV